MNQNMTDSNINAKIVVPGEELGVIEEFVPEANCFEEDGVIFSSSWGEVQKDKKYVISVSSKRKLFVPTNGAIGMGYVSEVRKQTAIIVIPYFKVGSAFNDIKYQPSATLHISNVSDGYVRTMHDALRPGDWVLCRISREDPLAVTLYGSRHFGVIHAACFQCGKEITGAKIRRNLIRCTSCGATQSRFLSVDFNDFDPNKPWEEENWRPRPNPRQSSGRYSQRGGDSRGRPQNRNYRDRGSERDRNSRARSSEHGQHR